MVANGCEIRKRCCTSQGCGGDRISELPDEILSEILSLLAINEAVRTSCLSKRWKSVYTSVRAIKIHARDPFTTSSFKLFFSNLNHCFSYNPIVEIDASNLEHLDLRFNLQDRVVIVNAALPLLTTVRLDISVSWSENPELHVYGDRLIGLLTKISNTKSLFLSSDALACLVNGRFYQQLPLFNNLRDLNLDVSFSVCGHILPWLLGNSPNLVTLRIVNVNSSKLPINQQLQSQSTPDYETTRILHHLEHVKFKKFQGSDNEMNLVGYLLKKAPVLGLINFFFTTRRSEVVLRLCSTIVELPKASIACMFLSIYTDLQNIIRFFIHPNLPF